MTICYLLKKFHIYIYNQTFSRSCNPSGDSSFNGRLGSLVFPGMTDGKGKFVQSSNSIPEHLAWHLFGKTMVSSAPEAFEHVGINTLLHLISHFPHDPFVGLNGVSVKLSSGIEHNASHRFLYVFSFRQKGRYKGLFWNLG